MLRTLTIQVALVFCICLIARNGFAQVAINEFSNGTTGAEEYVELVVTGTPACGACTDISGWIVDDNNGYFEPGHGSGIASGHMRFANVPQWQCINIGSIILIYNNDDKNPLIPADDPTDADSNCVYILPHDHPFLPEHNSSLASNAVAILVSQARAMNE